VAWCEDLTLIARADAAPDAVHDEVERAFSANEIVALTLAIVAINGWNRLAISMHAPVGQYVPPRASHLERASGYPTQQHRQE
jgi:alkylhydroperoxidase family enzyme